MDRHAYEQLAALERDHWWFRGRRRVYLGLLAEHLAGSRPRRALDLGCGCGGFLEGLEGLAEQVIAADTDLEILGAAAERGGARALCASGGRLPVASDSLDLVCLFDVLEHLEDDRAALGEVARVLAPGGRLFASVPAYPFLYSNNDRVAHHHRRYTRAMLAERLRAAGLEVERNTHTNVLLAPLIVPVVLATKAFEALPWRRARRSDHTNLSWRLPRALHEVFYRLFAAELFLTRRFDWPAGHSIAVIARKPLASVRTPATDQEPGPRPGAPVSSSSSARRSTPSSTRP